MQVSRVSVGALAATVVGLGASITSLVDDLGPVPTFCAETGCATVRHSEWAHPLGIPMSAVGAAFFVGMLVLAFVPADRRVLASLNAGFLRKLGAILGGAWAMWLVGLQAFAIGEWCKLCLVADGSAVLQAALVIAGASSVQLAVRRIAVIVPALAGVVLVLFVWTRPPGPPDPPKDLPVCVQREQVPGVVTIVEFVDFECPFCRLAQQQLEIALAATPKKVRVVRKMFPLPMHPGAVPAALAWCCADMQGHGDAMARALFTADPSDLRSRRSLEQLATSVGCDIERYHSDMPAAMKRATTDMHDARDSGIHALPTLFIGVEPIVGAPQAHELLAAISRAGT
jgi:uncharacterized membrane protein/predicted DsbA family dithiol-disulfide isomerase